MPLDEISQHAGSLFLTTSDPIDNDNDDEDDDTDVTEDEDDESVHALGDDSDDEDSADEAAPVVCHYTITHVHSKYLP